MSDRQSEDRRLKQSFILPAIALVGMWLVFALDTFLSLHLSQWGIIPRTSRGVIGIFTAPWIHGSLKHLFSNSFPLLFLAAGVRYFYRRESIAVFLVTYLATGLWVWVAARSSSHIGASGVVYGLAFFLFFSGVFRRELQSLTLALIVAFFYGGIVWGIFPGQPGISWESHLFGAIAGIVLAWYYRKQAPPRKQYSWEQEPEESPYDAISPWNYQSLFPPPDVPDNREE